VEALVRESSRKPIEAMSVELDSLRAEGSNACHRVPHSLKRVSKAGCDDRPHGYQAIRVMFDGTEAESVTLSDEGGEESSCVTSDDYGSPDGSQGAGQHITSRHDAAGDHEQRPYDAQHEGRPPEPCDASFVLDEIAGDLLQVVTGHVRKSYATLLAVPTVPWGSGDGPAASGSIEVESRTGTAGFVALPAVPLTFPQYTDCAA
jgi:hypothetical protein